MGKLALVLAVFSAIVPTMASAASLTAPTVKEPETRDTEFRGSPLSQDLPSLVSHVESCIASKDVLPKNIPGIDLFLSQLEETLRKGYESNYFDILVNADEAREHLRLAHNDLAEAEPLFMQTRKTIKEVSEKLSQLLERNRDSVRLLGTVADAAKATVSGMTLSPPGSTGAPVPVERLCAITPLEPELRALKEKLRQAAKDLQKANGLVSRAKKSSPIIDDLAEYAGELDAKSVESLNKRHTQDEPDQFQSKLNSREIIVHADKWLKGAIESSEQLAGMMKTELDPRQKGLGKAIEDALQADGKTQDGKVLEVQSGQRISFNHAVRLNDLIPRGWEIAGDQRKPWWVGRASMAKAEAQADSAKMSNAHREAETGATDAEAILQTSLAIITDIDRLLGTSEENPQVLAQRPWTAPYERVVRRLAKTTGPENRSETVKPPRALRTSQEDVLDSFDSDRH